MRSDRQFCGQRCRVWWYWHRGQKRFDFSPSGWGLPEPPRKGQPKTLAAALKMLAESRKYATELEAAARAMQLVDHSLRSKLTAVRAEMAASKSEFLKELEALQDELEETQQRLAEAARHAESAVAPDDESRDLATRLEQVEGEATELRTALERAKGEVSEIRTVREQEAAQHADEVRALKSQVASAAALRDHLNRQNAELVRSRDTLRSQVEKAQHGAKDAQAAAETTDLRAALARAESERGAQRDRADQAERTLAQRDVDLKQQRELFAAAERAHKGTHFVAQSESRSLYAEKERRIAAEQRIEQLSLDLEALAKESLSRTLSLDLPSLLKSPLTALLAENREVRGQRDKIDAEREQLAARLLEWMSPGQYLEHAAAADYDITKDPLIQVKLKEIRVENELSHKQAEAKEKGEDTKATARALDPTQTVVEQAYAAALSDRWGIKHKPHKRHRNVEWSVIGIRLDERSEEYLLKRAQRRIAWMRRKQEEDRLQRASGEASG